MNACFQYHKNSYINFDEGSIISFRLEIPIPFIDDLKDKSNGLPCKLLFFISLLLYTIFVYDY